MTAIGLMSHDSATLKSSELITRIYSHDVE